MFEFLREAVGDHLSPPLSNFKELEVAVGIHNAFYVR